MDIKKENEILAIEHWNYIYNLLDTTLKNGIYTKEDVMRQCRFHYITAWEHGAKHYAEMLDKQQIEAKIEAKTVPHFTPFSEWLSPEHVDEILAGRLIDDIET